MLELTKVSSGYGRVGVLHDLSLNAGSGEVIAVLGANGAGKTTLARTISGSIPLTSGSIAFADKDISQLRPHQRARRGLVQVPEGRNLFASLTVEQNINLGRQAASRRQADADGLDRLVDGFPRLRDLWKRQAGLLSGGEQQMVALARAAAGRPRLLILDEPSLGLSPLLVDEVFSMIHVLSSELGCTIILIEQLATRALQTSDRGIVLAHGRTAVSGSSAELLISSTVREAYLGASPNQS